MSFLHGSPSGLIAGPPSERGICIRRGDAAFRAERHTLAGDQASPSFIRTLSVTNGEGKKIDFGEFHSNVGFRGGMFSNGEEFNKAPAGFFASAKNRQREPKVAGMEGRARELPIVFRASEISVAKSSWRYSLPPTVASELFWRSKCSNFEVETSMESGLVPIPSKRDLTRAGYRDARQALHNRGKQVSPPQLGPDYIQRSSATVVKRAK